MSATFDHLIPVSDGGTDAPVNLRLAHLSCNSRRGAGGVVQLLLVG
jgi:5-methylcytosine-specific restriction endonuclease McrA